LPLGNRIYELSNGNFCCAVRDDFTQMLGELSKLRDEIDHVMVETPGTELPISFLERLKRSNLDTHYTIDSIIAVADATVLTRAGKDEDFGFLQQAQMEIADIVLLSKMDLLFPALRKNLRRQLRDRLGHGPDIISMQHGLVRPELLFGRNCASEQRLEIDKASLDAEQLSEEFDSMMLNMGEVDSDLLVNRLQMLIHDEVVYRAKGFAQLRNMTMRQVVQTVGPRINRNYDRHWQPGEHRGTRLEIIGKRLDRERVTAALQFAEV